MAIFFVIFADVEGVVADVGRVWVHQVAAKAEFVRADIEAHVVRGIVTVRGTCLGEAPEHSRLCTKLKENLVGFS